MRQLFRLLLLLVVVLALSGCDDAGVYSGTLIVEGVYAVDRGQTLKGELAVIGGEITLVPDSRLSGSVYVLDGTAQIGGTVDGDLVIVGGRVVLGPQARVHGNLKIGGGVLSQDPGATIDGAVTRGTGVQVPAFPQWTIIPTWSDLPIADRLGWSVVRTLLTAALAYLLVRFWPRPAARIAQAIVERPAVSAALGLLTLLVIPALLVLMAFTIVLIPVALVGALLLGGTIVYGWIALGHEIGQRAVRRLRRRVQPATQAFLGTMLLMLALDGLGPLPVVGLLAAMLPAAIGLGGVLLTRYGTRTYISPRGAADSETAAASASSSPGLLGQV